MTNPPTDDPLATLERLLKEATPGPWRFGNTSNDQRMILGTEGRGRYVATVQIHQTPRAYGLMDEPEREANAALIAHLRNLAPALVEAAKAARKARDQVVAWSINELGAEAAVKNVAYLDEALAALRALEVKK